MPCHCDQLQWQETLGHPFTILQIHIWLHGHVNHHWGRSQGRGCLLLWWKQWQQQWCMVTTSNRKWDTDSKIRRRFSALLLPGQAELCLWGWGRFLSFLHGHGCEGPPFWGDWRHGLRYPNRRPFIYQKEDPLFIRKLCFTPLQSCPCTPTQMLIGWHTLFTCLFYTFSWLVSCVWFLLLLL